MTVTAGQARTKKTQDIKLKIRIKNNHSRKVRSIRATTLPTKNVVKPLKMSTIMTTMQALIAS